MASRIERVDPFSYELTYVGGSYVMSGERRIDSLSSTVARLTTADGLVGYGRRVLSGRPTCRRMQPGLAALAEIAPKLLGLDAADPVGLALAMDTELLGHPYAKSAIDIASWDIFGQACKRPICDLIGGRRLDAFPLYVAISLGSPAEMVAAVESDAAGHLRALLERLPAPDQERHRPGGQHGRSLDRGRVLNVRRPST